MKQGTVSVLVGCHSPIHSLLVIRAWHALCGHWPVPWEATCVFLHDIGHWGKDYLNDPEQKRLHWQLGARLAQRFFGERGWYLTAGHDGGSGFAKSLLYRADKLSWWYAPTWWLWANTVTEPKLMTGYSRREAIRLFREQVKESILSGDYRPTHEFYLERCGKIGKGRDGE